MTGLRHLLFGILIVSFVFCALLPSYSIVYGHPYVIVCVGQGRIELSYNRSSADGGLAEAFMQYDNGPRFFVCRHSDRVWFPALFVNDVMAVIPFWLIIAVLLPPWWLMGRKVRRRKRWASRGRCLSCGYDLTGNESGACPECNAAVEAAE